MTLIDVARAVEDTVELVRIGARYELYPLAVTRPPARAADDAHIMVKLRSAYQAVTGSPLETDGVDRHGAYTDASLVATLTGSSSCTVFHPGSSDWADVANQCVEIEDLGSRAAPLGH